MQMMGSHTFTLGRYQRLAVVCEDIVDRPHTVADRGVGFLSLKRNPCSADIFVGSTTIGRISDILCENSSLYIGMGVWCQHKPSYRWKGK